MSCEDRTQKHPYVYSCCPESLDGITTEFLKEIWVNRDLEGYHIICGACRKVYHIYKLGMKWNECIATDEELAEFNKGKEAFLFNKIEPEKQRKDFFILEDIPKFRCKVCKCGMFQNESIELQMEFIKDLNSSIGTPMKITEHIISKEQYIEQYNISQIATNTCRRCTELGKQRIGIGKYN